MKSPEVVEFTTEEMNSLIDRAEKRMFSENDYSLIIKVLKFSVWLQFMLEEAKLSIHRLKKMLGFPPTPKKKASKNRDNDSNNDSSDDEESDKSSDEDNSLGEDQKGKGHGRLGEKAYIGAETEKIAHHCLKHGDSCPNEDCNGRVYLDEPGVALRIKGNAIASANRYVYERLRCNLCDEVFPAKLPEGVKPGKSYDESALAMIAISKYFLAVPFHRLQIAQEMMGIPLADSTQFDKVEELVNYCYRPYLEIVKYAAQGDVIHNDDTPARILSLIKENESLGKKDRKGMFTTGIVSKVGERYVYLYFTGREHAGENLGRVLCHREPDLGKIIQMADASSSSLSKVFETILCLCLAHGLRKFSDIDHKYPDECEKVLNDLSKVYKNDALAKEEKMSPEQRLQYHQQHSAPIMEGLKKWMDKQIDEKLVEANNSLGKAIKYMRKYWYQLTQFLRIAGAPLDNNICESALKLMIRIRKNSMFFKSEFGAFAASILLSLIYTTAIADENPKDYLEVLQKYPQKVRQNPELWLPWNYRETVQMLKTESIENKDS